MRSPFKFLDSYTLEDKSVFFGRNAEIEALYEMVFKTPLSLVYGLSGTGKTSLIQCGLAGKFDGPDWHPFWIRRNENLNDSITNTLETTLGENKKEKLVDNISYLFRYYLRPVYLIFDQFEELFILGTWEEQEKFINDIKELLDAELPCKILFVMREEYIGQLYHFEKHIPTLFDHRLRVEPMNNSKVMEVMKASFDKFNISLEGDEEERLQQMIDNISGEKSSIQLPYLQVYLDMLYREDYYRTYGKKDRGDELPTLSFTKSEINSLGKIDNVLNKFLLLQLRELQNSLTEKYKNFKDDGVRKILDAFVTEKGTKRPMSYVLEDDKIVFEETNQHFFPKVEPVILTETVRLLEQNRILRGNEQSYELAHDSLASLIDQNRSDEQRQLNEVKNRVSSAYKEYQETGECLSPRQLISMESYLNKIQLEDHLQDFVSFSEKEVIRIKEEKRNAYEKELQVEKARAEKERGLRRAADKSTRVAKIYLGLACIVIFIAISSLVSTVHRNSIIHGANAEKYKAEENYSEAIKEYEDAEKWNFFQWFYNEDISYEDSLKHIHSLYDAFFEDSVLVDSAKVLQNKGISFYGKSKEILEAAIQIEYPRSASKQKLQEVETLIEQQYQEYMRKGDAFKDAGGYMGYKDAAEAYKSALSLKEGDDRASERLAKMNEIINSYKK